MSPDMDPSDPLLAAIGELRRELIGWIDARLDTLRDRAREAPSVPGPRAAARPQPPPQDQQPPAGADPRHRLDVLARHLGERLRVANPPRADPADDQSGRPRGGLAGPQER